MMVEFNPDGSIKLPEKLAQQRSRSQSLMGGRCMKISKDQVSTRPPKVCHLNILLSSQFTDSRFVENIFNEFNISAQVPLKLSRLGEKEFRVEVGTAFSRCSDCTNLIQRYRNFLDSNVIEEKGTCDFKRKTFCYEDYFD